MTASLLLTLLLVAAPAAPGPAPAALGGNCAAPVSAVADLGTPLLVELAGLGGPIAPADCTAQCGGSTISCVGTTCNAQDRNCSIGQRGHVQCDGGTIQYCGPVCAGCTNGTYDTRITNECCEQGNTRRDVYKCINNQWVYDHSACGLPYFCGDPPRP